LSLRVEVAHPRRFPRILMCTQSRSTTSSKDVRWVTRVAASVQPANIHDSGLRALSFDL
jgi:hypothetical protein